jgi:hypothetical protein
MLDADLRTIGSFIQSVSLTRSARQVAARDGQVARATRLGHPPPTLKSGLYVVRVTRFAGYELGEWYGLSYLAAMRVGMFLMIFLTGCAALPDFRSMDWRQADTETFTFSMPRSFGQTSVHGTSADAFLAQYTNQDMTITFDEGISAGGSLDSLSKYGGYSSRTEQVRGEEVQIVTFDMPPGGEHRFDHAIAASYPGIGLSIYAHCRTTSDYETATKIFKTIQLRRFYGGTSSPSP